MRVDKAAPQLTDWLKSDDAALLGVEDLSITFGGLAALSA